MTFGADGFAPSGIASKVAAAAGGLVLLVALLGAGAGAGIASLLGGGGTAPSGTATEQIPPGMLALYQRAAKEMFGRRVKAGYLVFLQTGEVCEALG